MRGACWLSGLVLVGMAVQGQTEVDGERILIHGRSANPFGVEEGSPGTARYHDAAGLLDEVPGAAVVRNGALTGIAQVRGVSGDRVGVTVDGMSITPACPNHMDPPLHYLGAGTVETMEVVKSVSPVRKGGDRLGSWIEVERQGPRFAEEAGDWVYDGEAGTYFDGRNEGFGGHWRGRVGNEKMAFGYSGGYDAGDDRRFPGGVIRATEYETMEHALFGVARTECGQWTLRFDHVQTDPAGTPTLPMDLVEDKGYGASLGYEHRIDEWTVEAKVYLHYVDHLMDRFSLRPFVPGPPAAGGNPRVRADSISRDIGFDLHVSHPLGDGEHRLYAGLDGHLGLLNAIQENVDTGRIQDTFNDSERDRIGWYGEWEWECREDLTVSLGARADHIAAESGEIDRTMSAEAAADAALFNGDDRSREYLDWDVAGSVEWRPAEWNVTTLGLARKTRAPGFVELFNYTPAQASAGMADGRNYIGNLELDPEVAHTVELSSEFRQGEWEGFVSGYASHVHDYIQGRELDRVSGGQRVLRYDNFDDVVIAGAEAGVSWQFHENFRASGTLAYTRGRNLSSDEDLYRIMPLQGVVRLDHEVGAWENRLEVRMVKRQGRVAEYNGETETAGYVLFNLRSSYSFGRGVTLTGGVENLLNEEYENHLEGINRVPGSDVAVGARLPAPGRFFYASAVWKF